MITDCELLEWAAKAAGYTTNHPWNAERLTFNPPVDALYVMNENGVVHTAWNPLADDGDALRLAAMLDINLEFDGQLLVRAFIPQKHYPDDALFRCTERYEDHNGDQYAATRRAVVRAATEIGKAMP